MTAELAQLRAENATLLQLLEVHEEATRAQFELIRSQRTSIEQRQAALVSTNEALAKNHAMLDEILRAMPGALLVTDAAGLVTTFNESAGALFELTDDELRGARLLSLFEGPELDVDEVAKLTDRGEVLRVERMAVTRTGRTPVLLSATTLHEGDGCGESCPRRLVCVVLDIRDRRRLEIELRAAQKLESVGRLASGVAHEINTPMQFVSDNTHFLRDAFTDIAKVVEAYRGFVRRSAADEASVAELAHLEDEVELEYLLEQAPRSLAHALEGLERVAKIVRSMKEFAHPDHKEMTTVDLNRAIGSTLTIAHNEYKYVADIETDFGEIPPVLCYAGEVNQAVLNVIVNAAHAIADVVGVSGSKGKIGVRTRVEGDDVVVAISDSGSGISPDIRDRIFDPFFTTKEVGQGTGQGLALCRSAIVDMHGGSISVDSELGRGTTFFLRLPVDGARRARNAARRDSVRQRAGAALPR